MNTIYNLPSDLPQPPAPPEGHRWSICGYGIPEGHIRDGEIAAVLFTDMVWSVHNRVVGNYGRDRDNLYVRAVPLREVPPGVPPLEPGWEYAKNGKLNIPADYKFNKDVAAFGASWEDEQWDYSGWCGSANALHYALKIGSKVHFENIVNTTPASNEVDDIVVPASEYNALVEELEHLREKDLDSTTSQFDLTAAVAHIKTLLSRHEVATYPEIHAFVAKFSPAFDWDALWSSLSKWSNWVAMDMDGEWCSFAKKPELDAGFWGYPKAEHIPEEFAPPTAPDWKESLVERPKNN